MSTDIVRFQGGNGAGTQEVFSLPALKLFLIISLPMMAGTFIAWFAIYWWINRRQIVADARKRLQEKEKV